MTLDDLSVLLDEVELSYRREIMNGIDMIRLSFSTDYYVDHKSGEPLLVAWMFLEEGGEFLKIVAPSVYVYAHGPHDAALFRVLLQIGWKAKMIKYSFDDAAGEIRAGVEVSLEDGRLTAKQLVRMARGLAVLVDDYHPVVAAAMETGVVDFGLEMNALEWV